MALTESGANKQDRPIINSLKVLFGEDFEKDRRLKEVLEIVIHNGGTQGERVFRITKSGFTTGIMAKLSNINAGITLGEFAYSTTNPDYQEVLTVINTARITLGREVLPNGKTKGGNVAEKVVTALDITQ